MRDAEQLLTDPEGRLHYAERQCINGAAPRIAASRRGCSAASSKERSCLGAVPRRQLQFLWTARMRRSSAQNPLICVLHLMWMRQSTFCRCAKPASKWRSNAAALASVSADSSHYRDNFFGLGEMPVAL
jgi:hypothetical protein